MENFKSIFIISLIFISSLSNCQNNDVDKIIQEISEINEVHYSAVSIGGTTTDHYINFEKLKENASIKQLLSLTKSENTTLVSYASWALCDRKYEKLENVFRDILDKNQTIKIFKGCLKENEKISSVFYHRLYNSKHFSAEWDSLYFTKKIITFDSIALHHHNAPPILIYKALNNRILNLDDYNRIRELALVEKNGNAIVALAKFKKEEDIAPIKNGKSDSFLAIAEFPHPDFWDFLRKYEKNIHDKDFNLTSYMKAIAAYKNREAFVLLQKYAFEEHLSSEVHKAITYKREPYYEEFIIQIWEEKRIIDLETLNILKISYPDRIKEILENGLMNSNANSVYYNYSDKEIIYKMLNILKDKDSDKMVEIINLNLEYTDFYELASICKFIIENEIEETIPTILEKIDTAPQAYDIHELTLVVLSFKNTIHNKELERILKKHKRSWKWGNWAIAFKKILSEQNIKI